MPITTDAVAVSKKAVKKFIESDGYRKCKNDDLIFSEFLSDDGGKLFLFEPNRFIQVDGIDSLLLPHSSLLSYVIFIGLFGIAIIGAAFSFAIFKNNQNLSSYGYLLILYILLNIIKSDSFLYLQIIIFYSSVLFMFIKIENVRLLNIQVSKQSVK